MKTSTKATLASSAIILVALLSTSNVQAWNPPDGDAKDHAYLPSVLGTPSMPGTLLHNAHGYITQNGLTILYNDGYWFAAQTLSDPAFLQELLNGVRYADEYADRQTVDLEICIPSPLPPFHQCWTLDQVEDWPYGADNHYFNPDTGLGLNPGYLTTAATWGPYITGALGSAIAGLVLGGTPGVSLDIRVNPQLASQYQSSLLWFDEKYAYALSAFTGGQAPAINGHVGPALGVFYLGWASHFMQDLTVVHHTFDQVLKNHRGYEGAADGHITVPPVANGQRVGIYADQLPTTPACTAGSRTCFPSYAAYTSHISSILAAASDGTYLIDDALALAQSLQAGLYAAFLTDVGQRPVHMSAVMNPLPVLL